LTFLIFHFEELASGFWHVDQSKWQMKDVKWKMENDL